MITQDELMAYVDGEASAELEAKIDAALETDPQLADRLEKMMQTTDLVREAFAPMLNRDVPASMEARVRELVANHQKAWEPTSDTVVAFKPRPRTRWAIPATIAASLIAGVIVGQTGFIPGLFGNRLGDSTGQLASIDQRLGSTLSSLPSGQIREIAQLGTVKPLITFRNQSGDVCRQFQLSREGDDHTALACRKADAWDMVALAKTSAGTTEFALAAGPEDGPVAQVVQSMIKGEPLDATQERLALELR